MPMNLSKAPDHPSVVLKAESEQVSQQQRWQASEALTYAAGALRDYETDRDVTFAALDNDALENLRVAWQAYRATPTNDRSRRVQSLLQIADIVGDLLGLDDENED